jgi:predicted nucleic acid-binding protein
LNELFVDTAGWMAMADVSEPRHEACRVSRDRWLRDGGILVSTDYVLDETLTVIRVRLGLAAASRWWGQVDGSSRVRWEWIDPTRADKARDWFFRWKDKTFSFTDCTSFVVMRELRHRRVLTTDRHFRQAGFTVLPR